jgi:hypothetical protein
MLSCKEISELVSDSLDRDLPWYQRLQVRVHLLMCRLCSRFRRHLLLLRQAARQLPLEDAAEPGASLSPEARERIKRAIRNA